MTISKFRTPLLLAPLMVLVTMADLSHASSTVLHFRVSEADEAGVTAGSVPGFDGSPDGTVAGSLGLSSDIPTEGVPAAAGNRSLMFTNTQVITIPGTQQLSNAAIIEDGGFTYETWFKWDGGGTLNAMIDYAGTEKFRIVSASGVLDMNFDTGSGLQELATPSVDEWHYVAAVFEHDGAPIDADQKIHGTLTWYFDSAEPAGSMNATKDDFGDSLNRTIGVGGHPRGNSADFVNGLMYEPRVSLGALAANELLYNSGPGELFQIHEVSHDDSAETPGVTITWNSVPGANYNVEYTTDLTTWEELDDSFPSGGETTSFTHDFLPSFEQLVGTPRIYYRVSQL